MMVTGAIATAPSLIQHLPSPGTALRALHTSIQLILTAAPMRWSPYHPYCTDKELILRQSNVHYDLISVKF